MEDGHQPHQSGHKLGLIQTLRVPLAPLGGPRDPNFSTMYRPTKILSPLLRWTLIPSVAAEGSWLLLLEVVARDRGIKVSVATDMSAYRLSPDITRYLLIMAAVR